MLKELLFMLFCLEIVLTLNTVKDSQSNQLTGTSTHVTVVLRSQAIILRKSERSSIG